MSTRQNTFLHAVPENDHLPFSSKLVIGEIMGSGNPMEYVYDLCDTIGPRPAGSASEDHASRYLVDKLTEFGLKNVKREPFSAPHWQRGSTKIEIFDPIQRPLSVLALPLNATHEFEGEVLWTPFETEEAFREVSPALRGKICLNQATPRVGMSGNMLHRSERIRLAAEAGATAFLWVSNWPGQVLSTGSMDPEIAKSMPAFGITLEDSLLLRRLLTSQSDPVQLRINTQNSTSYGTSWNVVAEIGSASDETVMVTAHYDSHDITTGAFDNASGCAIVLECARVFARHYPPDGPRLKFVIFSAEEVGLHGSQCYVDEHQEELRKLRLLINADGLGVTPSSKYMHVPFRNDLVTYIDNTYRDSGYTVEVEKALALNWDHAPFALKGVPVVSITTKWPAGTLLHYGHTSADTPDKLDPQDLRYVASCVALLAARASLDQAWPFRHLTQDEIQQQLHHGN